MTIRNLTKAERLEVSRRRADLTQKEAAELLGIPFFRYKRMEKGDLETDGSTPSVPVGALTQAETCRVFRRRAGYTLAELEAETGLKAKWLHRAEVGNTRNIAALVEFWRARAAV